MANGAKYVSEITERYVYDVTRRLPQTQRSDIEKELRGLIEDMLQNKAGDGEPGKEDIDAVLLELGKPSELAAKYKGEARMLIGPEYYDTYLLVLKIVLAAAGFGMLVAFLIGFFIDTDVNPLKTFAEFIAAIVSGLAQAFAWVTIVFALVQKYSAKRDVMKESPWHPNDLPEIPAINSFIPKSEPIMGIIFAVLGVIVFNSASWLFGIWYHGSNALEVIPVFDPDRFALMLPLINIIFCIGIFKEGIRLLLGRYSLKLAFATTACTIAALILSVMVFGSHGIWNKNLISALETVYGFTVNGIDLYKVWMNFPKFIVGVTVFGSVIDVITTFSRSIRAGA
ncbi:MAG: hypothetical protein BWY11_00995 [Firmicutes bacterium ADurb.Bin182]|nr:MAG: hypothetical protein BWY11_00995 [Firmicutes bacterium ADurb.Bin182]